MERFSYQDALSSSQHEALGIGGELISTLHTKGVSCHMETGVGKGQGWHPVSVEKVTPGD